MLEQLIAWVLAAMIVAWSHLGPIKGATPKDIASAIAQGSLEKPLYEGSDGAIKTAALITATGVFESGFRQIPGDCHGMRAGDARCGKGDSSPTSFCFLQVHFEEHVERVEGYTPEELMKDPLACVRAGREIMRASIKKSPKDDPLNGYAGGNSNASSNRWKLAKKLFAEVKLP